MLLRVPMITVAALTHCCMAVRSVEVGHIVVMVFIFLIQNDSEITGIQPRLGHTRNDCAETAQRQAVQRPPHYLLVRAEVQKCRDKHIPADASAALQIQHITSHPRIPPLCAVQGD